MSDLSPSTLTAKQSSKSCWYLLHPSQLSRTNPAAAGGIWNWPLSAGMYSFVLVVTVNNLGGTKNQRGKTREVVATMNTFMKTSAPPYLVMNLATLKVRDLTQS